MRTRIISTIAVIVLTLSLLPKNANSLGGEGASYTITIGNSSQSSTTVTFNLNSYELLESDIGNNLTYTPSIPGELIYGEQQGVLLPFISRAVRLPEDGSIELRVVNSVKTQLNDVELLSENEFRLSLTSQKFGIDSRLALESFRELSDGKVAELSETYVFRRTRGANLAFFPFDYDPVNKVLTIYDEITVEIISKDGGVSKHSIPAHMRQFRIEPQFDDLYEKFYVNNREYLDATGTSSEALSSSFVGSNYIGDMLIISPSVFFDALQPLIDWKHQKGIKTKLVDILTIENDTLKIKNYIEDWYFDTDNTPAPNWVLLVGTNSEVVSTRRTHSTPNGPRTTFCDIAYAQMPDVVNGNNYDDLPDFYIGRFSATTGGRFSGTTVERITTQVERSIKYERDLPLAESNLTWFHRATGMASDEDNLGHNVIGIRETDKIHMERIRTNLLNGVFDHVDEFYAPEFSNSGDVIADSINSGRSLVNYTGHGTGTEFSDPQFTTSNVNALTNDNMLPIVVSVGCETAEGLNGNSLAETFLQAKNSVTGEATGAIATYMSTGLQSWAAPMYAQDDIAENMASTSLNMSLGQLLIGGAIYMYQVGSGGDLLRMLETWHVFGDPSLLVRNDTPRVMVLDVPGSLAPGNTEYFIGVTDINGNRVLGVWVAFYAEGELLGAGRSVHIVQGANVTLDDPLQKEFVTITATNGRWRTEIIQLPVDHDLKIFSDIPQNFSTSEAPYPVTCRVSSNSPLNPGSPELRYRINSSTIVNTIAMTLNGTDYEAFIPAQSNNDIIYYEFWAENANSVQYTTQEYSFRVIDYEFALNPSTASFSAITPYTNDYYLTITNSGTLDDAYDLSVSGSPTWNTTIMDNTGTVQISQTSILQENDTYSFIARVNASPAQEDGFSDVAYINVTSTQSPAPPNSATSTVTSNSTGCALVNPNLTSPIGGGQIITTLPELMWDDILGVEYYDVEFGTDNIFATFMWQVTVTTSSWQIPDALALNIYYWRVRGRVNGNNCLSIWGDESFEVYNPPPPPPPSCPVLFVNSGGGYVEENPLLTACEESGYRDIVTDYYQLRTSPKVNNDRVTFQLRELEDEITFLNDIQLLTIDHSATTKVACDVNGNIFSYMGEQAVALTAIDQNGNDRLAEVVGEDGIFFRSAKSGSLTLTFPNNGQTGGYEFNAIPKQPLFCPPDDPFGKPVTVNELEIPTLKIEFLNEDGTWAEIQAVPSRINPVSEIVLIALPESYDSEIVTIRLSWEGSYSTDVVRQLIPIDENPIVKAISIADYKLSIVDKGSGKWSGFGEDTPLILRKGDIFEFSFQVDELTGADLARDFVIVATGRYEPDYEVYSHLLPTTVTLHSNYPNPFNPTTTISYSLPGASHVKLEIYNSLGQLVKTMVDGYKSAGHHQVKWKSLDNSGTGVASGVYFYRLVTDEFNESKKMMLLK